MTSPAERMLAQYRRDSIMSATPAHLLVMLMDRLALDIDRAAAAQEAGDVDTARHTLGNAQAIVAELMSSLDVDAWEGAPQLFAIYAHLSTQLVNASVSHAAAITRECARIVAPLRDAWREASTLTEPATPAAASTFGEAHAIG